MIYHVYIHVSACTRSPTLRPLTICFLLAECVNMSEMPLCLRREKISHHTPPRRQRLWFVIGQHTDGLKTVIQTPCVLLPKFGILLVQCWPEKLALEVELCKHNIRLESYVYITNYLLWFKVNIFYIFYVYLDSLINVLILSLEVVSWEGILIRLTQYLNRTSWKGILIEYLESVSWWCILTGSWWDILIRLTQYLDMTSWKSILI